jgi:DNA-binding NarL/FixJ family response regulator
VAVLDVTMPGLNGLDATRAIVAASPGTRVLILTVHESEQLVHEVLTAGARGYLLKSDAGTDLVGAIEAIAADNLYFASRVAQHILNNLRQTERAPAGASGGVLSARERELVQLLAEGRSTKEIARILEISVSTAETHRRNIMRKMGFESVSDVVRYAIKNRMIEP